MKLLGIQTLLFVACICNAQQYFDTIFLTSGSLNFRYQIESVDKKEIHYTTSLGTKASIPRDKVVRYVWSADPEIPFPRMEGGGIGWVQKGELPGVSSSDIYLRSKLWFVENFKNAGAVIQMDDENRGIIIGKGNTKIQSKGRMGSTFENRMDFTLKVEVKDQKYRITVSDIGYHDTNVIGQINSLESIFNPDPPVKPALKILKSGTLRQVHYIIYELGDAIKRDSSIRDDW